MTFVSHSELEEHKEVKTPLLVIVQISQSIRTKDHVLSDFFGPAHSHFILIGLEGERTVVI